VYFRQILHPDLGCASYLIADHGKAAVIDPKWEIDEYREAAADARAEIRHVLETHNHADHVSGRCRLTSATAATAHIPAGFSGGPGMRDGDVVRVGDLDLVALATPGHRPEHVAYLVHDDGIPRLLLSGDSLLVGDVARPDLAVAAAEGARALWDTLKRLVALGDQIEVWPAHVGGSLCASRSASSATSSTIGLERRSNPLLSLGSGAAFTAELTRCMPARPPSVERVVALNLRGAADPGPLRELDASALARFLGDGICVLDIRDPEEFDAGHLDGSINLPAGGSGLGSRAAWAAGTEEPIVLVSRSHDAGRRAAELLRAAGVWNLGAMTVADPQGWKAAGLAVRTVGAVPADRLVPRISARAVTLLDVRDPPEWSTGHVAGSRSLPLSELGDGRNGALALEPPIAVVCASGARAALAASILRRRGHDPVWRVTGGVEQLAHLGASMIREPL
jgi:hydroxyacylglutathione hydrolase